MIVLEGVPALSPFRRQRLQSRLQSLVPGLRIEGAWHVYFVQPGDAAPDPAALPEVVNAERVYQRFMKALDRFAVEVTALAQGGSLPTYLGAIFLVVILLPGVVAATALPGTEVRLWDTFSQAAVGLFVIAAAILAVRGRNRLQSVMFVGLTGYVVEPVSDTAGLVKVHGDLWTARTDVRTTLPLGSSVQVVELQGATLLVDPASPGAHY